VPAPVVSGRESTRRRIADWRKAGSSTRIVSEKRRARRGGSFATASTHASCQCLAITRPLSTLQLVVEVRSRSHTAATGRPCRRSLTHERLHGKSDSAPFWGEQSPFQRAPVSRQHLRTHQPALRRNGSKRRFDEGSGPRSDGASLASQGVVASLIGKRLRLNTGSFSVAPGWSSASASLATASTHTYATSALTPIRLTGRRDSDTGALRSAWLATQPRQVAGNSPRKLPPVRRRLIGSKRSASRQHCSTSRPLP